MAKTEDGTLAKNVNLWVQTLGIVLAGGWALYTFVYKEITLPKSAPVNISMGLDLKKMNARTKGTNKGLLPIEVTISARNPSSRQVFLLPSGWAAFGENVAQREQIKLPEGEIISSKNGLPFLATQAFTVSRVLVATGRLLTDVALMPGEISSRRLIFFVAAGTYDVIDVEAIIPTVTQQGIVDLSWNLRGDVLTPSYFRAGPSGGRTAVSTEEIEKHFQIELQTNTVASQLSLW